MSQLARSYLGDILTAKSSKNHTTGGLTQIQNLSDLDKTLIYHVSPIQFLLGMGIVENSTVRFSVLLLRLGFITVS